MFFERRVSPDELAKFLGSNDDRREALVLTGQSYVDFDKWTEDQFDAVVEAAKRNKSVRAFSIRFDSSERDRRTNADTTIAETISSFVRHLRGLRSVDIDVLHVDNPYRVKILDILLRGIIKSEANIKCLVLSGPVSPGSFLKFAERFPDLEELALTGPCSRGTCAACKNGPDYTDFATEVAVAASCVLRSLRRVTLHFRSLRTSMLSLLADMGGCAALKELIIVVGFHTKNDKLQDAVARFCAITRTLESLKIASRDEFIDCENLLDVTAMFRLWSRHRISDSIREIHFYRCELSDSDVLATTLTNVEVLHLKDSCFHIEPSLLKNLPLLKSFHSNKCNEEYRSEESIPTYVPDDLCPGSLEDNSELEMLCEAIEGRDASLDDIELYLKGWHNLYPRDSDDLNKNRCERFAATERLLRACKGKLVVNFESLPVHSHQDIVEGLTSLRCDLTELRLRFEDCQFTHSHYCRILKAVQQNATLAVFEFGFDRIASDQLISHICDLVASNDTLDTLSLRLLTSNEFVRLLERVLPVLTIRMNRKLRSLYLIGADLTDAWPRLHGPMISMLEANPVLSQLGGCTIPWGCPMASRVCHLLKLNGYGRRFLPPHHLPVPAGLWATILARIAKDGAREAMHTFLRSKVVSLVHGTAYDPPASSPRSRKRGRDPEE